MTDQRKCGECRKPIYYGLYCSNLCSNVSYERWLRIEARKDAKRCGCKACYAIAYPEEVTT